jgi:hypothetical protein
MLFAAVFEELQSIYFMLSIDGFKVALALARMSERQGANSELSQSYIFVLYH